MTPYIPKRILKKREELNQKLTLAILWQDKKLVFKYRTQLSRIEDIIWNRSNEYYGYYTGNVGRLES